ncbi:pentapeptide repeat-containing protein [Trueperella pyogenes]|uniref:pentapeptide repeat-containing protein n=1 Tax=Trueperella pyogenes TaxID=1661 RepID=UPI00312BB9A0
MMTNAEKIQEWRNTHPAERITAEILRGVLNLDTLRGADLRGANLWDANLWDADLQGANLWHADLRNADLQNADLRHAELRHANLRDANLRGANLLNRNSGCILQIVGLYEYATCLTPTPGGWQLHIGCWHGTVASLRKLAAQDDGWPEAKGKEILRRRPLLYAIADMCDTHITNHQGLIEQLAKKWGTK